MNLKTVITSCVLTGLLVPSALLSKEKEKSYVVSNPVTVKLGDPFVLHASDGRFYMYGTSTDDSKGYEAYVSDNLADWTPLGYVYHGAGPGQWNRDCFWAPEVYERDGMYYMFYSANHRDTDSSAHSNVGGKAAFRIGVAVADSPAGPFKDLIDRPIFDPGYPVIDANVLFDDPSGKCYLYYSRCCSGHPVESELSDSIRAAGGFPEIEESWIYGVELKPDFSGIVGEPVLLLSPPSKLNDTQAEWESRSVKQAEAARRWTEGSFIFRHDDTYYMTYSANAYTGRNYAVGYATSESPLGPFIKSADNPIISENASNGGEVIGTGHNMVFTLPSEQMVTVYHGRLISDPKDRYVFISLIHIDPDGHITVEGPTTGPTPL